MCAFFRKQRGVDGLRQAAARSSRGIWKEAKLRMNILSAGVDEDVRWDVSVIRGSVFGGLLLDEVGMEWEGGEIKLWSGREAALLI